MTILETERLRIRRMSAGDAEFIRELLQEPDFLRYIGDKGVRTADDARHYIATGPVASYEKFGFGLYVVETKGMGTPVGMCGLLKRPSLDGVDLGFAFLERHRSRGYALESAAAVADHADRALGIERLLAITAPDNESSIRLLGKLGFRFERTIRMPGSEEDSRLFSNAPPVAPADGAGGRRRRRGGGEELKGPGRPIASGRLLPALFR